jgi:hypothetical protein
MEKPRALLKRLVLMCHQGKNVVSVKGGCIDGLDWKAAIHIWFVPQRLLGHRLSTGC